MSVMSTIPVFACKYCGKPVFVTMLKTNQPDENGETLAKYMAGLSKIAMCRPCRERQAYLQSQGRGDEMWTNPDPRIITVRDYRNIPKGEDR